MLLIKQQGNTEELHLPEEPSRLFNKVETFYNICDKYSIHNLVLADKKYQCQVYHGSYSVFNKFTEITFL